MNYRAVFLTGILFPLIVLLFIWYSGIYPPHTVRPDRFSTGNDSLLLFAHRGVEGFFPENSLQGFRISEKLGMEGVELDVRMTADGQIAVFHDKDCMRLLGNTLPVSRLTMEELREHPILFRGRVSASRVISLEDFFRNHAGNRPVYIDIKPIEDFNKSTVIDSLLSVINRNEAEGKVILANSDILLLGMIRRKSPGVKTALEGFNAGKEWLHLLIPPGWRPDYYSGFAGRVDAEHISWLRERELLDRRIVYGVDSSNFRSLRRMGIHLMIIDYGSYLNESLPVSEEEAIHILSETSR